MRDSRTGLACPSSGVSNRAVQCDQAYRPPLQSPGHPSMFYPDPCHLLAHLVTPQISNLHGRKGGTRPPALKVDIHRPLSMRNRGLSFRPKMVLLPVATLATTLQKAGSSGEQWQDSGQVLGQCMLNCCCLSARPQSVSSEHCSLLRPVRDGFFCRTRIQVPALGYFGCKSQGG